MDGSIPSPTIFKMDKEVKNIKKQVQKNLLLNILNLIKEGNNFSKISKILGISKQNINYYALKLKKFKYIKKIGYGVWELTDKGKNLSKVALEVRGHAFMWKVKIPKIKNWENRIEILKKLDFPYKLIGSNRNIPRILVKGRKVWLGNKYLIIYEPSSFIAETSTLSKEHAVESLLDILDYLERKFKISFKIKGNYNFKVRRNHYSLMKNLIARQFNKEGKKIMISHEGELWFIIDNSYNLEEAETVHVRTAEKDNLGFQQYMNSHKRTEFQVTPDFILKSLGEMIKVQDMHSQNIVKHQKVLDEMLVTLKKIQESLER